MKIFAINGGAKGSSWNICIETLKKARSDGHLVFVATPDNPPNDNDLPYIKIGSRLTRLINKVLTRIDGSDGFRNYIDTMMLIKRIKNIKPDVVHLHTLHGYFINIKKLILFLKKEGIRTIITLHDCWWFTGRCSHFYANNCYKWESNCYKCKYKKVYPKSFLIDKSKKYFFLKEKIFTNFDNLVITCVSKWLTSLSKRSPIFKSKQIITVYNGVDSSVFYPLSPAECDDRKSILCVSNEWTESKGLQILLDISSKLYEYSFTVVGKIPPAIQLPRNVTNIRQVKTKEEMNRLYNSHIVYLNLSVQETFSLTNIEAQMTGTPIVCYGKTGMKETIAPIYSSEVKSYSADKFIEAINNVIESKINSSLIRNFAMNFRLEKMSDNYYDLYINKIRQELE